MLDTLHQRKLFKRHRVTSYDRSGGNYDFVKIEPGQTYQAPVLKGPGIIRHIWLCLAHWKHPETYRGTRLVMRFDGDPQPQVDVPLADFFLFGHGTLVEVQSIPIQVWKRTTSPLPDDGPPFFGGLNCTFPMPFARSAEIALINTTDEARPFHLHYYVDWEEHTTLDEPVLHFHGTFHEELTTPPKDHPPREHGRGDPKVPNLSDAENYRFLDAQGFEGHYVGTGLSVECKFGDPGKWWEGDDMFVIDNEPWPPRLHGTGTEDYFNLSYGFRKVDCRPEFGMTYLERPPDRPPDEVPGIAGKFSMYRFHISDPIPFKRSIVASVEHGHANDARAHYRSVAYWYGRKLGG